jgi:YD repeat-containing protein
MLDGLEAELRCGEISAANQQWLAQCGLTAEQMARQLEPVYTPLRKLHLYHCDHRGLPLALIHHNGSVAWQAEYDAWGNVLREDNPEGWNSLSACRASSTMQRRGCIITGTGITTRRRDGITRRIRWGWRGMEPVCVPVKSSTADRSIRTKRNASG